MTIYFPICLHWTQMVQETVEWKFIYLFNIAEWYRIQPGLPESRFAWGAKNLFTRLSGVPYTNLIEHIKNFKYRVGSMNIQKCTAHYVTKRWIYQTNNYAKKNPSLIIFIHHVFTKHFIHVLYGHTFKAVSAMKHCLKSIKELIESQSKKLIRSVSAATYNCQERKKSQVKQLSPLSWLFGSLSFFVIVDK